jgi:hypothetical protein
MRTHIFVFIGLAACGGGGGTQQEIDAPAKDVGFNKPTASLKSNTEVSTNNWMELGPADLSCLGMPTTDTATTVDVTLNTKVTDFQGGQAVPSAVVTAFDGVNSTAPFDTKTADANGLVSIHVGVGHTRIGFKMTAPSQIDTLLLFQYLDPAMVTQTSPDKIQSVSNSTAATLPALIGETRTPGSGVLAGALRDCQLHEMSNFIATVSSVSGTATPLENADSYYFSASVGLPVHHAQQESASGDGLFMIIQLPTTDTAFVQAWGYLTDGDMAADHLTLLSELQVPVLADTVITGSFEPLRH